jgi:hypothetical protein
MSLNTSVSPILGFPTDTGGIVRQAPSGAVVDNVFIFQDDAGTKWERVVDGVYRAKWCANTGDSTSRLQTVFNHANVQEVVFDDGDITINGTLNIPSGKWYRFSGTGAVTGSGRISGGSLSVSEQKHVFKGTIQIRPDRIEGDEWNAFWFGALGNGLVNDQPALQRMVDEGIASTIHNWYVPPGTYNLAKGVLIRKDNGSGEPIFPFNARFRGGPKAYSTMAKVNHTRFLVAANSFGLGIDRGKGCIVEGIGFEGQNYAPGSLNIGQICENHDVSIWTSVGVRDDNYSPHAGLVIDPFTNASTAAANPTKVYPGFEQYYVNTSTGGSTDILVKNCYARQLVVGFCITPHATPQNGDHIEIRDTWSEQNKVGFSLGQSQNRTISFVRVACWGNTETVFDCRRYGDGTSGTCEVTNCNIAGGVKYLCRIPGFDQNNGFIIRDCHAELLWAIGGSFGDGADQERSGTCRIMSSFINLIPPSAAWGYNTRGAQTIFKGKSFLMDDSIILCLNGPRYRTFNIDAIESNISNSVFESAFTFGGFNTQNVAVNLNNVKLGHTLMSNTKHINVPFHTAEYSDKEMFVLGSLSYTEQTSSFSTPRKATYVPGRRGTGLRTIQPGYQQTALPPASFTALDQNAQTGTLAYTPGDDALKMIGVGTALYMPNYNHLGNVICGHVATVTSVNIGTGVVDVDCLAKIGSATIGQYTDFQLATPYQFYLNRIPSHYFTMLLGDITSGSNLVTNVDTNTVGYFYGHVSGMAVDSPFFPPFTRIQGWDRVTKTLTLSHNATATKSNVLIEDVAVRREMYAGSDPLTGGFDFWGWTEGDVIYNNGSNPANDNILRWECTKSGLGGAEQQSGYSARISEWKAIYKTEPGASIVKDVFTLGTDGTRAIPEGKYVTRILVNPAGNLAAFKVGYSAAGDQLITEQPVTAEQWTPFNIDYYFASAGTLYFTGITSSTQIIVFYE